MTATLSGTTVVQPTSRPATSLRRPSYRDPRLIAGVLLVTASVVTGAKVVSTFDETVPHYAAARPLAPGDRITPADLAVVDVNLGQAGSRYLPISVPATGLLVTQRVGAGGLLPVDAVAQAGQVGVRPITLPVSSGAVAGLSAGDLVDVWVSVSDPQRSTAFLKPELAVQGAQVKGLSESAALSMSGADRSLTVMVPEERVAELIDAMANNARISVVRASGANR